MERSIDAASHLISYVWLSLNVDMDILIAMADNHLEVVIETEIFFLYSDKIVAVHMTICSVVQGLGMRLGCNEWLQLYICIYSKL